MQSWQPLILHEEHLYCQGIEKRNLCTHLHNFLKMPPAEDLTGFFVDGPSVFTLSQEAKGGDHMTSLMVGALGGFNVDLASF